jgi:hypothetical protein
MRKLYQSNTGPTNCRNAVLSNTRHAYV